MKEEDSEVDEEVDLMKVEMETLAQLDDRKCVQ